MNTPTDTDLSRRVAELHQYIAEGRILEAMDEFYDENVSMQDNLMEPCVGRAANVEREKSWLETVQEWKSFEAKNLAVVGDTTFAETSMDYVTKDGQEVHQEQVSRAVWRNGRIVDERFYHA